jgi:PST family polysaccharide transporter
VVTKLGGLVIAVALARILGPEAFGTFAVAVVAMLAVLSFNELGVSLAIVRWPGDPRRIVPTVNTISLGTSTLLYVAAWFATPAYTSAMGSPEATGVVRLLLAAIVVNGLVASPAALLQRDFRERTRMGIDLVNIWSGTVLSLLLALTGMGAMALAIGRVVGTVLAAVLLLRASPMPYRLGWDGGRAGALLRFGMPLAGSSIIVFGIGYADQLVAGAVLGPVILGFYVLASNLAGWPVSIVSQPLRRVVPAALSVIQDRTDRVRELMTGLLGLVAAVMLPAFAAIAGAAVPIVRLVYGEQWVPAAAALSWLVAAAMATVLGELVYDLLVVIGRTATVLTIQLVSLVVLVPSLVLGARLGGLAGVACAFAAVSVTVVLPAYLLQLRRVGIGPSAVLRALGPGVLGGAVTGGAAWWASVSLDMLPALAVGAAVTLAVTAQLVHRRRATLRLLRDVRGRVASGSLA